MSPFLKNPLCSLSLWSRLFEEHAEILELFEKFSTLRTKEEQQESLELAEHASMVMNTLHNAISSLDNPDAFIQYYQRSLKILYNFLSQIRIHFIQLNLINWLIDFWSRWDNLIAGYQDLSPTISG